MTGLDWTPEEQAKLDAIASTWEPGWQDAEMPTAAESDAADAEIRAQWAAEGAALALLRQQERTTEAVALLPYLQAAAVEQDAFDRAVRHQEDDDVTEQPISGPDLELRAQAPTPAEQQAQIAAHDREARITLEQRRLEELAEARRRVDNAKTEAAPMPAGVQLSEFLDVPDEPVAFAIEGVLPTGGNVILGAQYKAGKSTVIGNVLRALVDGDPLLGAFEVHGHETRRVALIDDELDERAIRRWLRDQGIRNTDRVTVYSLRGRVASFDIMSDAGRARWVEELRGHDTLLFDCLRPALDAAGLDENSDAGQFLLRFDSLKAEAGIEQAIIVHHFGHNGERSRGDSRILDWPDATWKLVRDNPDDPSSARYFSAFGRDVDVTESLLEYDTDTRHLSLVGGNRQDKKTSSALEPVLEFIRGAVGGATQNQAEAFLVGERGITRTAVRSALKLAETRGLTVVSRGPRGANIHQIAPRIDDLASSP